MAYGDDEKKETHPSYALVSFSRRQGNPGVLFGSPIENHNSYITLSVCTAEKVYDRVGGERYYGNHRGSLLEIDLSPAQFAELLTTMNVALGVPGTLRYLKGEAIERPKPSKGEVENIRSEFGEEFKKASNKFTSGQKEVEAILEKKSPLSKDDKAAIREVLATSDRLLTDMAPFLLDRFHEATERVITHAKAEIDSVITHNVIAEGIKSLAKKASDMLPQLGAKSSEEDK